VLLNKIISNYVLLNSEMSRVATSSRGTTLDDWR